MKEGANEKIGRRERKGHLFNFTRHFDVHKTETLACTALLSKIIGTNTP